MAVRKPTQAELNTFFNVLDYIRSWAYAINATVLAEACEEIDQNVSTDVSEMR